MAVKKMEPATWPWKKDPGLWNQVSEGTSPHLLLGTQDQRPGAEQDQLPCGSAGTSSGNCQEPETRVVHACHMLRQPLQNHPSGHLGRWVTLWSAEEMLDRQHQPFTRAFSRKDWKRISAESFFMSPRWPSRPRDWTELNCGTTASACWPLRHRISEVLSRERARRRSTQSLLVTLHPPSQRSAPLQSREGFSPF